VPIRPRCARRIAGAARGGAARLAAPAAVTPAAIARAGKRYVIEVRAGKSRTTLGKATRKTIRVR
jgi:hypothetical protein